MLIFFLLLLCDNRYEDEDEEEEDYYMYDRSNRGGGGGGSSSSSSGKILIGNRRWGAHGYMRDGRMYARPSNSNGAFSFSPTFSSLLLVKN